MNKLFNKKQNNTTDVILKNNYIPEYIIKKNYKIINWDSLDYSNYNQDFISKYEKYVNFSKITNLKSFSFKFIEKNKKKIDINVLIKHKHPLKYKFISDNLYNIDYDCFFKYIEFNYNIFEILFDVMNEQKLKSLFENQIINRFLLEYIIEEKNKYIDFDFLLKTNQNLSLQILEKYVDRFSDKKLLLPILPYNVLKEKIVFNEEIINFYISARLKNNIEKSFFFDNLNFIVEHNILTFILENNLLLLNQDIIIKYGILFVSNTKIWNYIEHNFLHNNNICLKFFKYINFSLIEKENIKYCIILKNYLEKQNICSFNFSNDICEICFDDYCDTKLKFCDHMLCFTCFYNWFKKSYNCPFCRKTL